MADTGGTDLFPTILNSIKTNMFLGLENIWTNSEQHRVYIYGKII